MTKRKMLEAKIKANTEKITELNNINIELRKELLLLSDKEQWFTEEMEAIARYEGRKKIKEEKLIGKIHWNEDFKDEDTGNIITIERSHIVRVDGIWR